MNGPYLDLLDLVEDGEDRLVVHVDLPHLVREVVYSPQDLVRCFDRIPEHVIWVRLASL